MRLHIHVIMSIRNRLTLSVVVWNINHMFVAACVKSVVCVCVRKNETFNRYSSIEWADESAPMRLKVQWQQDAANQVTVCSKTTYNFPCFLAKIRVNCKLFTAVSQSRNSNVNSKQTLTCEITIICIFYPPFKGDINNTSTGKVISSVIGIVCVRACSGVGK